MSLAEELFHVVESEQGFAFISDGLDHFTDEQVVAIARGSLYHTERTAKILRAFLKRHGHLNSERMLATGCNAQGRRPMPTPSNGASDKPAEGPSESEPANVSGWRVVWEDGLRGGFKFMATLREARESQRLCLDLEYNRATIEFSRDGEPWQNYDDWAASGEMEAKSE